MNYPLEFRRAGGGFIPEIMQLTIQREGDMAAIASLREASDKLDSANHIQDNNPTPIL